MNLIHSLIHFLLRFLLNIHCSFRIYPTRLTPNFCIYYRLFFYAFYGLCKYLSIICQLTILFSIEGKKDCIHHRIITSRALRFTPTLLIFFFIWKNLPLLFYVYLFLFYSILQTEERYYFIKHWDKCLIIKSHEQELEKS